MKPLEKTLRNKLEKTVKEARDIAEVASRASLEQLGVGAASPFAYLSEDQKELRRKLRAHGRQLGDQRNPETGAQEISRLVEEVAYEHWHRMLFARFLAENNLLMYPDPVDPVAVTLEECEDMAADEGAKNGWELASRYAARMLPQIFRPDSPVFQLILSPEHQQKLERLLAYLPSEVFTASDSLGWVYQYWQAKKKEEINKSGVKIGARELPAVTQLFTEPYMVSFLLDNSLGAWWAARRLTEEDLKTVTSEEELRQKASLPGVPLEYLRFIKTEDGVWTPAAGTFDGWPENLSELKTLDPCGGSGHFLVAAFLMLVPMRMEMEGLTAREAVDAVLFDNLHGLEIDQRCVELAAFNLALTAWHYPGAGGYRILPEIHIACSGLSISAKKEDWMALAGDDANLKVALEILYEQFMLAPVLGSLINPESSFSKGNVMGIKWEDLAPLLKQALSNEQDDDKTEMGVVAQGIVKAATLLTGKYHWVMTNVPYLARGKQNEILKDFCDKYYNNSKNDLATVFLNRCLKFCYIKGVSGIVLPQNWLFLPGFKHLRKQLLETSRWRWVVRLGSGAFETISGEVVKAILIIVENESFDRSGLSNLSKDKTNFFHGLDVSKIQPAQRKAEALSITGETHINLVSQKEMINGGCIIRVSEADNSGRLGDYARAWQGLVTGDDNKFIFYFWEISAKYSDTWSTIQRPPQKTTLFTGRSELIRWERGNGTLHHNSNAHNFPPITALGKWGIAVQRMSTISTTLYTGEIFNDAVAPIIPHDQKLLPALWAFAKSSDFSKAVREVNQKVNVTPGSFHEVEFDIEYWKNLAAREYPNGLPKPYSDDPTQWIFHGNPAKSDEPLQVAVARLLGYRWPAEIDTAMELSDEAKAWVKKCDDLLPYADEDGIVCIPPVRGEVSATDQLLNLLAVAYGDSWSNDKLSDLLKQADHAGKPMETWLREKFFTQHCKLFQHRPFIWHIWDGLKDGFAALVNYHKLDKKLLETLIYTYLGDWISRQKQDKANGVDGSQEKLDAAESLKKKLELILEGEAPYDIFVRWKPIEKQPVGWDPDLNDGVRLNIRPFMSVPDVSKKGAGVLRDKPNINWNKDRGTDIGSAPWYNLGLEYGGKKGDRVNDHHLNLKQKKEAREAAK